MSERSSTDTAEAVLNDIRDALESRGYFHMANGRDIGLLLDEGTKEIARLSGVAQCAPKSPAQWRLFESVLQRGSFGIETSDRELVEACDEKIIYHGLTRSDAESIVRAFNAAIRVRASTPGESS